MARTEELLTRYKCHKEVQAMRIWSIVLSDCATYISLGGLDGSIRMDVSPSWNEKHQPSIGGYYVLYEDGYESYSPAKAFEDGYSTMEDGALNPPLSHHPLVERG